MRLGVLPCEKLKHRETHGRIVSLDQLRLGVEKQLLIFRRHVYRLDESKTLKSS